MTTRAIAYAGFPMMHDLNPYVTCMVGNATVSSTYTYTYTSIGLSLKTTILIGNL